MNTITTNQMNRPPTEENFKIKSALAGLELGPGDQPLLKYLDFLSNYIPLGRVNFVHVIPKVRLFSTPEDEQSFFEENYQRTDELYAQLREKISGWSFPKRTAHLDFDIRIGNPLEELLEQAKGIRPDLVMIGQRTEDTHHGILAKNFARKVKANALIVPENSRQSLSHMLVPIDFSKYSVKALELALKIRSWMKQPVKISCLHVFELPNMPMDRQKPRAEVERLLSEDRKKAFTTFLNSYFQEEASTLQVELIEKKRTPVAKHIHQFARNNGVDMTIMGAVGHSKVELLLMGSVTEKYLSLNKEVPTLLVKK